MVYEHYIVKVTRHTPKPEDDEHRRYRDYDSHDVYEQVFTHLDVTELVAFLNPVDKRPQWEEK